MRAGDAALKRIRELAHDSRNVVFTGHARQKMVQRGITSAQVLETLRKGTVEESAHLNTHRNWQVRLRHRCAGDEVTVAAALEQDQATGDQVVVITAF